MSIDNKNGKSNSHLPLIDTQWYWDEYAAEIEAASEDILENEDRANNWFYDSDANNFLQNSESNENLKKSSLNQADIHVVDDEAVNVGYSSDESSRAHCSDSSDQTPLCEEDLSRNDSDLFIYKREKRKPKFEYKHHKRKAYNAFSGGLVLSLAVGFGINAFCHRVLELSIAWSHVTGVIAGIIIFLPFFLTTLSYCLGWGLDKKCVKPLTNNEELELVALNDKKDDLKSKESVLPIDDAHYRFAKNRKVSYEPLKAPRVPNYCIRPKRNRIELVRN